MFWHLGTGAFLRTEEGLPIVHIVVLQKEFCVLWGTVEGTYELGQTVIADWGK